MALYLTPAALGYLTQLILVLLITGYFTYRAVNHRAVNAHEWLLPGFFACGVAIILLFLLDASLSPSPRLYAVYLENLVIGLFLTLLTQFAYHFPHLYPQRQREARFVLIINLLYTLGEAGFAVYRGRLLWQAGYVMYRPLALDYALLACFGWTPLVFLRQISAASEGRKGWHALWRPQGRAAQAVRAFALIFLIPLGLSLLNIWRANATIHPALFQASMSAGILLTQFLLALVYLNFLPETTTFRLRLVGLMLVLTLALFSAAGWVMTPSYTALYRPALADRQTLRFTPNAAGGYDVMPVPFYFDTDLGSPLVLQRPEPKAAPWEDLAEIAFPFPFYGQLRQTVWVMRSGAVSLDVPLRYPNMEYHYAAAPAIFPLFTALGPGGEIFASDVGEHLTLTWYDMPSAYVPQARFTFQLVLHQDGVFEITTNGLPGLPFESNGSPFTNVWLMGATPGTAGTAPQAIYFTQTPLAGGPQGLLEDYYLEFRRYLHSLLYPLAALILVSSLLVVTSFPAAFYVNLIRPLNALLEGVRRLEAGEYTVATPVQFPDEIGFLTRAFNHLAAELGDLIHTLEARVAARTAELDAANGQLRAEIAEREQAQATIMAQQRALAAAEEREDLSRELHDGLGQKLGFMNVQAQAIETLLERQQFQPAQVNLRQLRMAVQEAHTEVRNSILGLRADTRRPSQTLWEALRDHLAQFQTTYAIATYLSLPTHDPLPEFSPAIEIQLLHILQEALTNIHKHARAHRVEVQVQLTPAAVQMLIRDDGVGFALVDSGVPIGKSDAPQSTSSQHFGLAMMQERVDAIGGKLEVRTAPGQGVCSLSTSRGLSRCRCPPPHRRWPACGCCW